LKTVKLDRIDRMDRIKTTKNPENLAVGPVHFSSLDIFIRQIFDK
jgi:hypothetical protein